MYKDSHQGQYSSMAVYDTNLILPLLRMRSLSLHTQSLIDGMNLRDDRTHSDEPSWTLIEQYTMTSSVGMKQKNVLVVPKSLETIPSQNSCHLTSPIVFDVAAALASITRLFVY